MVRTLWESILMGTAIDLILSFLSLQISEWKSRNDEVGIETRPPISGQRIVVKLDWNTAPLACENFATLCANGSGKQAKIPIGDCGKPLTYRGSTIHRVIPGFVVQGGDFVKGNGSGGESIFGKKFKDERAGLAVKLDRRGVLAMGNSGKNSVSPCPTYEVDSIAVFSNFALSETE
jgi:cyclophilin family peptidyl-prolyl cis-trans isomerase